MTKLISSLAVLATLSGIALASAPAQAQSSRTFVSAASGNDANNCNHPTPCRTFQGAHDKTNAEGEITVLDPGGYGAFTITKSISIVNDGVGEASILVSGGAIGIKIEADAAAAVNLRGITVQGIGFGGGLGLRFTSGHSLTVTNCVFRNHSAFGIELLSNIAGTINLSISDTLVADNGGPGIRLNPLNGDATVRAVIDRVHMVRNGDAGLLVGASTGTGTINVTVTDSVSSHNGNGFFVSSSAGRAPASLTVIRSIAANNAGTGLIATDAPAAILRIGQSTITGNALAFSANGPAVQSFGDNYIAGNTTNNLPPTIPRK